MSQSSKKGALKIHMLLSTGVLTHSGHDPVGGDMTARQETLSLP